VKRHGQPRGEKSRAIVGTIFEAVATHGHNTSIDVDAVLSLYAKLRAAKCPKLFSKLFQRETKYSLAPGYEDTLKAAKKDGPANLPTLFYGAVDITPKTPSLNVRAMKAEKSAKKAQPRAKKATAAA
jgi:hypothetical protein